MLLPASYFGARAAKPVAVGVTTIELEVANPTNPGRTKALQFIVDSGAVYSVVPSQILRRLNIKPLVEESFHLADGSEVVRKKGGALFRFRDRVGVADVIFGERGDAVLLGALTLEALGLSLDPLKRALRPMRLMH